MIAGAGILTDLSSLWDGLTFSLYGSGQVPSDTPLRSWTPPTTARGGGLATWDRMLFEAADWYELERATTYGFVVAPLVNQTTPRKATIADTGTLTADIRSMLKGEMNWTHILEVSGGASWTKDADSSSNMLPIFIAGDPAAAGRAVMV